ncbi:MAG TPA: GNAT family N-acetyltransferase [Vicinamibacteria bacterium]|nr:GNAT family N-acetyltransferase [Vicinamibacteria bacterium]
MTRHRASYDDAGLLSDVLDLLSTVFPFFREQEQAARRLGLRWESCSTPFVCRRQGRVVAHVGLLEMPLQMNGRRTTAGSVHGVATHPELRRRGYFRSIMEELLGWCDERYETLQLCTDNPEYFESFGFRVVEEHHFVGAPSASSSSRRTVTLDDPALLRRLLALREPVSNRLGVLDRNVFLFNEARHSLVYCEELQTVLSCDVDAGRLVVWDVVAPELPSYSDLLGMVAHSFDTVEVHFAPDRLGTELEPVPDSRREDVLMVRGPYLPDGLPFKLPATARC